MKKPNRVFPSLRTLELLEDRLAPATLLHSLFPDAGPQAGANFGLAVGADANFYVVGAYGSDVGAVENSGQAFIYDATNGTLLTTLNNPTPAVDDHFGDSVAVSGNTIVVGAYFDDTGASDAGSAYVFNATTGALVATLNNPTPAANEYFGVSVAISGNVVLVGAHAAEANAGAAYLFDATTGALLQTLNNPTPASNDYFGISTAISGNTVVVGAKFDDTLAADAGSAYVFDASTGALVRTLNKTGSVNGDQFGTSVAVSGNTIVVGAVGDDTGATDAGAAFVFNSSTGVLVASLHNPTPAYQDDFGGSVAVSGNMIVVTADLDDTVGINAGSAYVFNGGVVVATLLDPTPANGDYFGAYFVALSGNTVVVGAYGDDAGATDAGSAYAFNATTGSLIWRLTNSTPSTGDFFGVALAVSGNIVAVGAADESDDGCVYLFNSTTGALTAKLNNPTPSDGDSFGSSAVAIWGDIVVVGAADDDTGATDAGSVYVFNAISGALITTLNNPTPASGDIFGAAIAVWGDIVVVGAYWDDAGGTDSGSAYVFNAYTGALIATLNNPAPATDDNFGVAVSISGNSVVVGAYLDDSGATNTGSAYVFDATSGALVATLSNPTPAPSDFFGWSVAIAGNIVVVGAQTDDAGATDSGTAYTFNATTGALLATLNNPAPANGDVFGWSVAISGNTVVVGARVDDAVATDSGSAYVFKASTGALVDTVNNPTPASNDHFGVSIGVSGDKVVVGAYLDDTQNTDQGAAYVFDLPAFAVQVGPVTPDPRMTSVSSVAVQLSEVIDLATFTAADFTLTRDGGANLLNGTEAVMFVFGTTYQIGGLAALTNVPGVYVLNVNMAGVTDLGGNLGTGSASDAWEFTADSTAPTISGVYIDGTAWTLSFRTAAGHGAFGYPAQTGAGQLTPMPWSTINTISIRFSEDVNLTNANLGIRGINVASYSVASFSYDGVNFVGKWVLVGAIDTDRVILDLDGDSASALTDLAGNKLAGSWIEGGSVFPTSGAAGVDFRYRFVVAVGDANRDGLVRNADTNSVRANLFNDLPSGTFNIYSDITGDGLVRNADLNAVRSHLFIDPPAGPGPNRPARDGATGGRGQSASHRDHLFVASRLIAQDRNGTKLRRMPTSTTIEVLDRLFEES